MHTCIGFTGSQKGMTRAQSVTVRALLEQMSFTCFHHGCCIGADEEADLIARAVGLKIALHPPDNLTKVPARFRENDAGDDIFDAKPYLLRNHEIVDATAQLIACPAQATEQHRSGTWATVRYAAKLRRSIALVLPDGGLANYYDLRERERENQLYIRDSRP